MTFKVEPEALDQTAALLERNRAVVPEMQAYIAKYLAKRTADQLGGQGLILWCAYDHDEQIARADHRLQWVNGVWQSGAVNLTVSAAQYRNVEAVTAAGLDAQARRLGQALPTVDTDPSHWEYGNRPAASFKDVADPTRAISVPPGDDIGSLEPQAAEVAQWVGRINDFVSLNAWVRFAIREIFGRDPIKEALDLLAGDWTVFARYSVAWQHVGFSVAAMADNIAYTDDALASQWQGNSADNALMWLQKMHSAMTTETGFYDTYLAGVCKTYVQVAYYAYENLNYLVGELLDLLAEAFTALMGLVTDGLSTIVAAVIALCDAIMFILDFFRQLYFASNGIAAVADMPEEPPLDIAELLLADPDPAGRNCITVPTTK
ncbi:hypothetical protein [Actinoplanes sp. NPDC051851]|uniref:hypothetical protein n=1 Tax=Actinoplanes sp. NPDC051851 TaxID=3154753 RepID=UPI0034268C31